MSRTGAPRIFVVAAEPSGDLLAADLVRHLRRLRPDVAVAGVGGKALAREGINSQVDTADLSVLGMFDGFKILKLVHERAEETALAAKEFEADAAILIDSWGFMLRAAWKLTEHAPDTLRIKYVGPQVFATRPGRAKVLARTVDHLLGIHPVDPDYFEPAGLPTTFVGNPALERMKPGDGAAFRKKYGLAEDEPVLLVLFGSRRSELERLYEPFAETVARVRKDRPRVRVLTVLSDSIAQGVRDRMAGDERMQDAVIAAEEDREDAFSAADLALACSGTVTLELASLGVPTLAAYRLGWASWALARFVLMRSKYISLVNIAADEMLIPEFVQTRCRPAELAPALIELLESPERRAELSRRLVAQTQLMRGGGGSPGETAARTILDLIETRKKPAA